MAARVVGAVVLILGPLMWGVGLLLRKRAVSTAGFTPEQAARFAVEPFAAREQMAAYAANSTLTLAGYALFLIGAILLIPAVATLMVLARTGSSWLSVLGGLLVLFGLLARLYFAGVEQAAFELVDAQGLDAAARFVVDTYVDTSYGPWRVPVIAAFGQYLGMPLLAAGLYRAKIFGAVRVLVLLWWATMWTGVLKAASWSDVLSTFALCLVLVPLAIELVRNGQPALRQKPGVVSW